MFKRSGIDHKEDQLELVKEIRYRSQRRLVGGHGRHQVEIIEEVRGIW